MSKSWILSCRTQRSCPVSLLKNMYCVNGLYYIEPGEGRRICARCHIGQGYHRDPSYLQHVMHVTGRIPRIYRCAICNLDYCDRIPAIQCLSCIEIYLRYKEQLRTFSGIRSHILIRHRRQYHL